MSDLVTTADEAALQRHPFLRGGDLLAAGAGGTIATTAAGTTPARAHDSQVLAVSFGLPPERLLDTRVASTRQLIVDSSPSAFDS